MIFLTDIAAVNTGDAAIVAKVFLTCYVLTQARFSVEFVSLVAFVTAIEA